MEEAGQKGWVSTTKFKSSFIGNWFTGLMLPKGESRSIKKMKSPKNHAPVLNENSDAVLAAFIDQQEMIWLLLEKAKGVNLRKTKRPFPSAGLLHCRWAIHSGLWWLIHTGTFCRRSTPLMRPSNMNLATA